MKNNFFKITIITVISALLFSCGDVDGVLYDTTNGQTLLSFATSSGSLPVPEEGSTFDVLVHSTTNSSSDRNLNISIDPSSTAMSGEYSIVEALIPANEFVGKITVRGNFAEIPNLVTNTIVFKLEGVDGVAAPIIANDSFELDIFRKCPSELEGIYDVISSGTSTDGAPVNNPLSNFSYTVEITKTGDIDYSISDGVAGVYQDWYCAPYGYCFETAGVFNDACGSLSGKWTEAFGAEIRLTGTDNADGTLTISWENDFGDTATAIYTKR